MPGDRFITLNKLKAKISENDDLNEKQRDQLLAVIMKYQPHLTKRPGKCNGFEYHFNTVGKLPKSASSRTNLFALRHDVLSQIQDMLNYGILEESYTNYINALTLVHREHKPLRICVDAVGVNRQMTQDRIKFAPIRELLQRFPGSRYITTLDLSSAFLRVPLAKSSRSWTTFNFENQIYHFTRAVFLNRRPRPGTGTWHQLYRAARASPGICHFSFLSNFHE